MGCLPCNGGRRPENGDYCADICDSTQCQESTGAGVGDVPFGTLRHRCTGSSDGTADAGALRLVGSNHGSYYATADPDHMARLMAVAFGESELPLQQIRVMRTCRHSLDVAKKLDYFVWNLVQKGTTEIPDLILAKKQHRENEVDAFPAWPAETIAKFEAERAEQAAAQAMDVDESWTRNRRRLSSLTLRLPLTVG